MEGLNPNFVEALLLRLCDYITLLVLTLLLFGLTFYSGMFDCYSWCWSTVHSMFMVEYMC